jgi:homocysteine S-methyltransferase
MNTRTESLLNAQTAYLTDGGLETSLIFHDGVDLPYFASFTELNSDEGPARLEKYYSSYLIAAQEQQTGFVLDTVTWRANAAWGEVMGMDHAEITKVNRDAITFAKGLQAKWETDTFPVVVNGVVGPAGDGYSIDEALTSNTAKDIHSVQINEFAASGADMVTAVTMTHTGEAIGVVVAAQAADVPVVVSFTVETDGNLPSGQSIGDAISEVDLATNNGPEYYMINCAHPDHFEGALKREEPWMARIKGIRANASRMSHAELDAAEELDDGNPGELASDYQRLQELLPQLKVLGGCCGTDHRHVSAIGHACVHKFDA